MGKSTFDPTSPGSQQFLLRVLKFTDIKAVNIEAVAQEEGITKAAALKKLKGIKGALEERLNANVKDADKDEDEDDEVKVTTSPITPPTKKARKISAPSSKRRRVKAEPDFDTLWPSEIGEPFFD